ncbi:MAG TPA: hypothetical protein V6C72_11455 [Chroococcales cyanobacterium]
MASQEITPKQAKWLELMEQVEAAQRQTIHDAAAESSDVMERLEQGARWSGVLGSEAMKLHDLIFTNKKGSDEIAKDLAVRRFKRSRLFGHSALSRHELNKVRALSAYRRSFGQNILWEPLRTPEILKTNPEDIGIDGMSAAALSLSYIFEIDVRPQPGGPYARCCRMNIYQVMRDKVSRRLSAEEKVYRVEVFEPQPGAPRAVVESAEATSYLAALERDFHAEHGKKAFFNKLSVELPDEFYIEPTGLILKACQELEGKTWDPNNLFVE